MFDAALTGGTVTNTGIDLATNTIINAGNITAGDAAGPIIVNEAATSTNPTLCPDRAEEDTGIGWASDTIHIVLGGADEYSFSTTALTMNGNNISGLGTFGSTGAITITPGAAGTFLDFVLETEWVSGTLINADFGGATTFSASVVGMNLDLGANVVATSEQDVTGLTINLPQMTVDTASPTVSGIIITSEGALAQTTSGDTNWRGIDITMPAQNQTADTITSYGLEITATGYTSGTQTGLYIGNMGSYAIYTGTGAVRFGGAVTLASTLALGGAVTGGDYEFTGVGDMTFTDGSILAAVDGAGTTLLIKAGGLAGTTFITLTSQSAGTDTMALGAFQATGAIDFNSQTLSNSGNITMSGASTVDGIDVSAHDVATTGVHGVGAGYIPIGAHAGMPAVDRDGDINLGVAFRRTGLDSYLEIQGGANESANFQLFGRDHDTLPGQIHFSVPNAAKNALVPACVFSGATDTPEMIAGTIPLARLKSGDFTSYDLGIGDTLSIRTGAADDDYFTLNAVDNDDQSSVECIRLKGAVAPHALLERARFGTTAHAADEAHRGQLYMVEGGADVADLLYCIMKGADNNYTAIQVAVG